MKKFVKFEFSIYGFACCQLRQLLLLQLIDCSFNIHVSDVHADN